MYTTSHYTLASWSSSLACSTYNFLQMRMREPWSAIYATPSQFEHIFEYLVRYVANYSFFSPARKNSCVLFFSYARFLNSLCWMYTLTPSPPVLSACASSLDAACFLPVFTPPPVHPFRQHFPPAPPESATLERTPSAGELARPGRKRFVRDIDDRSWGYCRVGDRRLCRGAHRASAPWAAKGGWARLWA